MSDNNPPILKAQVRHALIAKHMAGWLQLAFLILLFILWLVLKWPFGKAAECCAVAGILAYSALNIYGALLAAWTGPALVARISRFVAVVLYVIMRYFLHYSFFHALLIWAALWIVSSYLVMHSRRRAVSGTPVKVSHLPS